MGMVDCRAKRREILLVEQILGIFNLVVFKIIWFKVEMACNSKTACRRAKRNEIWESEVMVEHIWGTFDPVVLHVILGSVDAILLKRPVIQNGLPYRKFD